MKNLFLFLLLIPASLAAQEEFSYKLYFEDAAGNKDTVVIGFDANGTKGIDAIFGEEDILNHPWSNNMEVRIGNMTQNPGGGTNMGPYPSSFTAINHTKKQIVKKDCSQNWSQAYEVVYVLLKHVEFPLTISWDHQAVSNSCTNRNFMTDWHPGCWFDCHVVGTEQEPFDLNTLNSKQLEYISLHNVEGNDTTQVLFVSMSNFTLNTKHLSADQFTVSKNPFEEAFSIQGNLEETNIQILDFQGKKVSFTKSENQFTPTNCSVGIYMLSIEKQGIVQHHKIVKL